MNDFYYIARDDVFREEFFEDIKSIIFKYWSAISYDMKKDLRVNGIRLSVDNISIMLVRTKDTSKDWKEWSHNIDDNKSDYYKEVSACIERFRLSVTRSNKLEQLGI